MGDEVIGKILENMFPFYNKLDKDTQIGLSRVAAKHTYAPGTVLHAGKEDCSGLFLIETGRIRAYIVTEEGKEITLFRLLEGDVCIFSASCMLKNIMFDIWVSTETAVEAVQISSKIYQSYVRKDIQLANFTSDIISSRMSDVMWILEQILFMSFNKRLAAFLLEQAVLEGGNKFRITHGQIANHLGSAREVVSRMLKYFSNEGYVKVSRGSIEIIEEEALRTEAKQ